LVNLVNASRLDTEGLAVSVRGLTKSYEGTPAVRGVDFDINKGEIFALLGPNGAGKTTTVEILEGYRSRDGGEIDVLGFDPGKHAERIRPRIGIVLQSTGIDRYLTVRETVAMYASFYPHPRSVEEVISLVGLDEKRASRVLKLSGGQQRRLDVAIALAGDPDLLFLDEPTTGFDPSARREAWEIVKNLAALGKTVLLTTHYMDEAQYLANRVAVIAAGTIVATGTPQTIGGRDSSRATVRFRLGAGAELPGAFGARPLGDGAMEIAPTDLTRAIHEITGWALEHDVPLESLDIVRPSLEDIYLELTGSTSESPPPTKESATHRSRRHR
jgi:ABC-2 type transport system ATP-binding protein